MDDKKHLPTWHIENVPLETRRRAKELRKQFGLQQTALIVMGIDNLWNDFMLDANSPKQISMERLMPSMGGASSE